MAELANILTGDAEPQAAKITTEMLDYDYVRKCNSVEDMKGIVQVLQSGREGHYPELQKLAEEKLLSMLPEKEKKKYMRLQSVPTPAEISEAEQDILNWEDKISNMDSVLRSMPSGETPSSTKRRIVPGVRGASSTSTAVSENGPVNTVGRTSTTRSIAKQGNLDQKGDDTKQKRLSGYDFRAWEKFDADAAAEEVEKAEEETAKRAETDRRRYHEQRDEEAKKRLQIHQAEMERLSESIQASSLTQAERLLRATREKEKGNECFKAGEHENALLHYSKSICLDNSSAAVYANRGLVNFKLNNFQAGDDDCTMAIENDRTYLKAWVRRGSIRFKMGKYAESIDDFMVAIALDPTNKEAISLLEKSKAKYLDVEGKEYNPRDDAVSFVKINELSTFEEFVRSVSSLDLAEISSGACRVSDKYADFFPSLTYTGSRPGYAFKTGDSGIGYYKDNTAAFSSIQSSAVDKSNGLTRIPVEVNEDDDDDDDTKNTATIDPSKTLTRIPISFEDEDEDEGVEDDVAEGTTSGKMTRIPISIESDDDDDDVSATNRAKGSTRIPIEVDEENTKDISLEDIEQAEILKKRGNECMSKNDVDGAIKFYSESIARHRKCYASYNNRALAYTKQKNFELAILDCSVVISSADEEGLVLKALGRRADLYIELSDYKSAQRDIDSFLEKDAHNSDILSLKTKLNALSSSAGESCDEIELDKLRSEAQDCLSNGKSELALEKLSAALRVFDKSSDRLDNDIYFSLLLLRGRALTNLDKLDEASLAYDTIIKLSPKHFKAYLRRSEIKLKQADLPGAKSDILHALRIDPTDSEARVLADAVAQAEDAQSCTSTTTGQKLTEEPHQIEKPDLESEKLKNSGNDALKNGDLQQALKLYTQALDVNPENTAALGNRAFVNLKLLRFVDAEKDATKVIAYTERGEQTVEKKSLLIKALYRRGLARRSMGGKEDLEKALSDFNQLLKMDPSNKEASIEKGRTEILIKDKKKTAGASKSTASNVPSNAKSTIGGENGELLLKEVQSVRKPRQVTIVEGQLPSTHLPSSPSDQRAADNYDSHVPPSPPTAPQQNVKSAEKAKKSPIKAAPSVPEELPKTVYELERIWRGLKGHPELFAAYLTTFKLSTFKKVFNDNVSSDLMSSVFTCTRDHISAKNPDVAARILEGLTQMPKFDLTASLFPEEDLSSIRTILLKLRDTLTEEKIQKLAQCYKVSIP